MKSFVLFMTLLSSSLTYQDESVLKESDFDFVTSILGESVIEDAIMRQLAFERASKDETYTVKEGDNLFRIALNYDVPLSSLMEWNDLDHTLIRPGDELIIKAEGKGKRKYEPISVVADLSGTIAPAVQKQETKNTSKPVAPAQAPKQQTKIVAENEPQVGKEMMVTATAYTAYCEGCSGTTAYGIDLRANPHLKVIAVDPKVIPLGTKVWVEGYGYAIAGDTGGAIKGNKIDVFIPSREQAMQWGRRTVKIKILDE